MKIARSFYFIRHGETDWNKEKRLQGSMDIPLNETGREQARLAAENSKDLPIDLIVSSSLSRAYETAQVINEKLQKPLITDKRLIEKNYGIFEGKKIAERKEWAAKEIADNPNVKVEPNGLILAEGEETNDSFTARIFESINEHLNANPGKNILFVAHAGVYRVMYRLIHNDNHQPENACPFLFNKTETGWEIIKI